MTKTRDIELTVELKASPEEVFRAVTEGAEVAKWLAPEARSTAPDGPKKGTIWISWGEGMAVEHEIDIYESPKHVRHPSGKNGETKAQLYADWSIEARDGGTTTLRLVHSGFSVGADWDNEFESHARGWRLMLENMRHYFARHHGEPAAHVAFMAMPKQPHEQIFQSIVGKLGLATAPKVGDAFKLGKLGGVVDHVTGTNALGLVVREYDDALLRFTLEGDTFVYAYAIVYGAQRERVNELVEAGRTVVPA